MMRKIIIVLLLGLFFLPSPSLAIGDQRCWKRAECEAARVRIIGEGSEAKDGFVSTKEDSSVAAACPNQVLATDASGDSDIGFCLPVGKSVTRISFGGTNEFLNIGEFIKFIYRYSMWAATIIAVMLVIVSGIQWTASGGNADMIGSAKKRIAGAISGLILLAFAYTILNTINPFLVNLRLPQAWLINEIGLVPPFCSQIKNDKIRLAYYKKSDEIIDDKKTTLKYNEAQSKGYNIPSEVDKQPNEINHEQYPRCGYDYLVEGKGGLSCQGSLCGNKQTCSRIDFGNNEKGVEDIINNPTCMSGDLIIRLQLDGLKQMIYANLDSGLANTLIIDAVEHPDWLDEGGGPENNMNLYYGCYGYSGVFPIELDWEQNNWFLTWNKLKPNPNNSLKDKQFSQYILNFKAREYTCPDKKPPTAVWVRIEINMGGADTDSNLFIGQAPDGKAMLGNWNDVAKNPIKMEEIEKTGVFLDGIVSGGVIESSLNTKHMTPLIYESPDDKKIRKESKKLDPGKI